MVEALVSISILGLIAVMSIVNFNSSQRTEELNTAARVLAADLRSAQSRALSGGNVRMCPAIGAAVVPVAACESGTSACADPGECASKAPEGVGVRIARGQAGYDTYVVVGAEAGEWGMRAPETVFFRRELERSGAPRVTVSSVFGDAVDLASADVAFGRQNGAMHVNECAACAPPPNVVTVTVRHALTGKTKAVVLNRLTGRVSIQ
jgi:type II secretory pathway pseudopilin PulG